MICRALKDTACTAKRGSCKSTSAGGIKHLRKMPIVLGPQIRVRCTFPLDKPRTSHARPSAKVYRSTSSNIKVSAKGGIFYSSLPVALSIQMFIPTSMSAGLSASKSLHSTFMCIHLSASSQTRKLKDLDPCSSKSPRRQSYACASSEPVQLQFDKEPKGCLRQILSVCLLLGNARNVGAWCSAARLATGCKTCW